MTVADRIRISREAAAMTQDELAKRAGYKDKTSISKIENSGDDISLKKVRRIAEALDVEITYLMGWSPNESIHIARDFAKINRINAEEYNKCGMTLLPSAIKAPILGRVAAGVPIEMITDILDTEELDPKSFPEGDYFGLVISGNSMEPKISEGDVVIVRQQNDVESGQIAIVTINGEDATCKKVMKYGDHLMLTSFNPDYKPMQFSKEDVEKLPIRILGRVVESRAKF